MASGVLGVHEKRCSWGSREKVFLGFTRRSVLGVHGKFRKVCSEAGGVLGRAQGVSDTQEVILKSGINCRWKLNSRRSSR